MLVQKHLLACQDQDCICSVIENSEEYINDESNKTSKLYVHDFGDPMFVKYIEIYKIVSSQYKKKVNTQSIKYLEIFVNIHFLSYIYSAYFEMKTVKSKKLKNLKLHHWFKMMMKQKQLMIEQKTNTLNYDIDHTIHLEENFVELKQLIIDTSLQVEMFWINLQKQEFVMKDILALAYKIVDMYL